MKRAPFVTSKIEKSNFYKDLDNVLNSEFKGLKDKPNKHSKRH
jgi:hypothetical protein